MAISNTKKLENLIDKVFDIVEESSEFMVEFMKKTDGMPIEEVLKNEYYVFLLKNGCFTLDIFRRFVNSAAEMSSLSMAKKITHAYEPSFHDQSKIEKELIPEQKVN